MAWKAIPVEWEMEPLDYLDELGATRRSDVLSAIDDYTDRGIATDVTTSMPSPFRIDGVLRGAGHEVAFYIESRGGRAVLTIFDIAPEPMTTGDDD